MRLRVGPRGAAATLERVWPRRAPIASSNHAPLDADEVAGPGSGAFDLELGAVEPVLRELAQAASLDGATLSVELSDAAVHLDVVKGDFAGHSAHMLTTVATACVAELLGDEADAYDVRWQLQSDDRHLLICAVARAHLAALAQHASAVGLRLASVQPDFVLQWNRYAGALRPGSAVFAVASGPALAIACVADGIISAISVATCPAVALAWEAQADDEPAPGPVDRAAEAERLDAKVGQLLVGLGLQEHARSGFSPSRPSPLDAIDELDARVDRLLAGIGQDPDAQTAFMLAAPDASMPVASQRWTVVGRDEVAR